MEGNKLMNASRKVYLFHKFRQTELFCWNTDNSRDWQTFAETLQLAQYGS